MDPSSSGASGSLLNEPTMLDHVSATKTSHEEAKRANVASSSKATEMESGSEVGRGTSVAEQSSAAAVSEPKSRAIANVKASNPFIGPN